MELLFLAFVLVVVAFVAPQFVPGHLKYVIRVAALGLALFCVVATSYTVIGADEVGHLKRIYMGGAMPPGQIIATNRENGPQAEILPPGFHFRLFLNILYDVERLPITEILESRYGLLIARDGLPLKESQFLASGWPEERFAEMLNAEYFLTNGGQKGPQLTVLKPGKYRLNRYLFEVKIEDATNIEAGVVGVIKSNVQEAKQCEALEHAHEGALSVPLVPKGCIGVWDEPLLPGRYYLNKLAYTVTPISTRVHAWEYKGGYTRRYIDLTVDQKGSIAQKERSEDVRIPEGAADAAIMTRSEGWLVPLELRVLVQVAPRDAPFVVASVGGLDEIEDRVLTPAIKSVARNVMGQRHVLDLLDKRSELEDLVEHQIQPEGSKAGVSIREVRFGDPSIPPELMVARLREQLAGQLQKTYQQEKVAQEERIRTEKARAEADRQDDLVAAEIAVKVAEQRKLAVQKEGEGEKLRLLEIAAGQQAQAAVLGEDKVLQLAILKEMLAAAQANPDIIKVPNVLVQGATQGIEGAAAILGASNFVQSITSSRIQERSVGTQETRPVGGDKR